LVVLVGPIVVFTSPLAIAVSAVSPGDPGSDPRPRTGKVRDGVWDQIA
jgi:hypothetical protein